MLKFQQFPAMQQGSRVQQILGDQEQRLGNKLIGKGFLNLLSRVQDCAGTKQWLMNSAPGVIPQTLKIIPYEL